ncbi:MAG TPA: ABC transporter permease [Vicinamibacterales bacterium]|nr:ABC transporter permease [Vicinamibacterales bacterium]
MSDDDVRRELEFHVDQQTGAYVGQGLARDEAARRARLEFGGVTQVHEACREVVRWRLLDEWRDDLRFALRLARRTKVLTATTLLALAIGIGASSTIFAVVNGVLLKPLPYADADELVMVWNRSPRDGGRENTISPADFRDLAGRTRTLERLEGYFSFLSTIEVSLGERTEVAYAQVVTPGLFDVLGRTAARGRLFRTEVYSPEVVISHGYWRRRFGEDPSVIGRPIRIGTQPVTIVGVMPADLVFPYPGMLGPSGFTRNTSVDMWVPMAFEGPMAAEQRTVAANGEVMRSVRFLGAIGRRRDGASIEQVRADLASVARDLEAQFPASHAGWGVIVTAARDQTVGKIRPALLLLFGGVALVLLMATVNVANLMLSRSLERRNEYATRVALGAGRARMLRQSIVESLLLAFVGGSLGLVAGLVGIRALTAVAPADLPRLADIVPDWRMVIVTLLAAAMVGLLIALVPALGAAGADPQHVLREYGRGAVGGSRQRRYRSALMVAQVALACVLTVGAALLLRSFSSVMRVDAGFRPDGLLTWQMNLPDRLKTAGERRAFYLDFFERLERLPGVLSTGGTTRLPLGSTSVTTTIEIQGRPSTDATRPEVEFRRALHHYFETMQIPLRAGRIFDDRDGPDAPPVAVINETMARRLFPGSQPVGQRLRTGSSAPWMEIVGVIGDVRHTGLEQEPAPELYITYLQNPPVAPFVVIRTAGNPALLMDAVRAEAQRIDPDLPLYDMRTMSEVRSGAVAQRRFIMGLVALFGVIALVLAAIGIDGVIAVAVNERMPEMSVRLALGADPSQLWRMVVQQSARTTAYGLAAGLVVTWLAMPLIRGQLFGVQPTDPVTIGGVVGLFLCVAVGAALVPARRAAHADPVHALRG